MKKIALAFLAVSIVTPAFADEMLALDFLIEGKTLAGQKVTVTNCTIIGAMSSMVMCNVTKNRNTVGNIIIDGDTLAREDLRHALNNCSNMQPSKICAIRKVTGVVTLFGGGRDVKITDAAIEWVR